MNILKSRLHNLCRINWSRLNEFHSSLVRQTKQRDNLKPVSTLVKSSQPLRRRKKDEDYLDVLGRKLIEGLKARPLSARRTRQIEEDFDDRFDEDAEDDIAIITKNRNQLHDDYISDEYKYRQLVRKKITLKKHFNPEKEPPLISWAEREEIRFLNELDPTEWNTRKLAESYPISRIGVIRLLKNCKKRYPEKIESYDKKVFENWNRVKKGELNADHLFEWKNEKPFHLLQGFKPDLNNEMIMIADKQREKPPGEFYALVKPFLKEKQPKPIDHIESSSSGGSVTKISDQNPTQMGYLNKSELLKYRFSNPKLDTNTSEWISVSSGNTINDEDENISYGNNDSPTEEKLAETSNSKTKFGVKAEIAARKWRTKRNKCDSAATPSDSKPSDTEKYVGELIEATKDTDNYGREQVYLYDNKTGYQHPVGFSADSEDPFIVIPERFKGKNCVFRVGDSYYNQDGEFMYKTLVQ